MKRLLFAETSSQNRWPEHHNVQSADVKHLEVLARAASTLAFNKS